MGAGEFAPKARAHSSGSEKGKHDVTQRCGQWTH